ncbi:hypothetical protein EDC04DRAFT_2602837 [Pisolithus marmoratus]|nr:hypothetical protein EDC04DRAFT_2602837 [Pisolithus marmoratus]
MLAVVQLENHVCEMSAQVEAARAERQALVAAAAKNILRIEEELSAQVCHPQQQMDKAKAEMKSRESELLKEIEVLQPLVRPTSLDIQRVKNALAMARENLAQEANALSQLRTEVEDLRRQIPGPSPP